MSEEIAKLSAEQRGEGFNKELGELIVKWGIGITCNPNLVDTVPKTAPVAAPAESPILQGETASGIIV